MFARSSRHTRPTYLGFVGEFPMTPPGKVQKFVLRERFVAGDLRSV
jgi:acyl-coenzyme A synthetase/AMP-(fatty) acid ligase